MLMSNLCFIVFIDSKLIRPEEDIQITLIFDGMCERLIFPDISKGRTEDCSEDPGQSPFCDSRRIEGRLKSNACQEAV